MRQWGSSLNHNGMSFFLATVPAHTQLYHGTWKEEAITGTEWLAFEPEHALIFARPRRGGPPMKPKPGHPPPSPPPGKGHQPHHDGPPPPPGPFDKGGPPRGKGGPPPPPPFPFDFHHGGPGDARRRDGKGKEDHPHHDMAGAERQHRQQIPMNHHPEGNSNDEDDEDPPRHGYLHTYAPPRPLNLLYIDGMSAGKTPNGTLDTQDLLLLNWTSAGAGENMWREYDRAVGMCNMTRDVWAGGKIDGVIRMEGGFEIILCDFEKSVELKEAMPVRGWNWGGMMGGWSYYQAIAKRYHGIGGGRVELDYDNFVTVFDYPEMNIWDNDVQSDVRMPRLQNVAVDDLAKVREAVTSMILARQERKEKGEDDRNWQEIVDMVVMRYSSALHYLQTKARHDGDQFADVLASLLRPFVDNPERNKTLETRRCVAQVVPVLPDDSKSTIGLSRRSVYDVTARICGTLLAAYDSSTQDISLLPRQSSSPPPAHALELVDELVAWLQWSTWKECRGCEDEELCMIPIWPVGTHEDHRNPQCRNEKSASERRGYWG
ncbi:hypothetical protein BU24DRAFT_461272 [Aaosphaeria arxii CBS 175.79]|uniref:Uncharacterized protein n=1 Tax=Aaosphaeria arxii CBS 175.79 TaxID=1450172 RepID=A0A6A5XYS4_9PLEO|nr:uncharacterized protein BU24DRAFT_461272 [Aaosphaeria arxii CBS 175.79]KAF2018322.1 hypothetical protein BU24DRAFT_461272 [Aaosphaeria arxii CBS 175.79]